MLTFQLNVSLHTSAEVNTHCSAPPSAPPPPSRPNIISGVLCLVPACSNLGKCDRHDLKTQNCLEFFGKVPQ